MTVIQDPRPPLPSPPSGSQSPTEQEVQKGLCPGSWEREEITGHRRTGIQRAPQPPGLFLTWRALSLLRVRPGPLAGSWGLRGPLIRGSPSCFSADGTLSCPLLQAHLQMVSGAGSRSSCRAAALPRASVPPPVPSVGLCLGARLL